MCSLIGEHKANISDLRFLDRKPDFFLLRIMVELRGVSHLHQVMTALEAETAVAQIARVRDPSQATLNAPEQARNQGLPGGFQTTQPSIFSSVVEEHGLS